MANQNAEVVVTEQKYQEILNNVLGVLDTVYTLAFRYPQLVIHDFLAHKESNGPGLDFTSEHPLGAVVFNGIIISLGCIRLLYDIKEFKKQATRAPASNYQRNAIQDPQPVAQNTRWDNIKEVAETIWNRLSFASFTYWLLWVGTTLFNPGGAGLLSLPAWLVFGIPLFIGFGLHPLITRIFSKKAVNIPVQNQQTLDEVIKSKFTNHNPLPNQNLPVQNLIAQSSFAKKYERLVNNKALKIAANFLWNWVMFFAASQYLGWIASDLFIAATGITITAPAIWAVFTTILVASTLYAAYKAYQKNQEISTLNVKYQNQEFVKNAANNLQMENQVRTARRAFPKAAMAIPHYNKHGFFDNVNAEDFTKKARNQHPILRNFWEFINGFMGGIFMARVFLVPSTVLFMPFTLAALSGPSALLILGAFGLAWGMFRVIYKENARKESNAKEFLEYGNERQDILKREHEYYGALFAQPQAAANIHINNNNNDNGNDAAPVAPNNQAGAPAEPPHEQVLQPVENIQNTLSTPVRSQHSTSIVSRDTEEKGSNSFQQSQHVLFSRNENENLGPPSQKAWHNKHH